MIVGRYAHGRNACLAALGAVCFFAAAELSQMVVVQGIGLSAVWAAGAMLLALLVTQGRTPGAVAALCTGAFAAAVFSHSLHGRPFGLAVMFACANVLEAFVAFMILRLLRGVPGPLSRVRDVMALIAACVAAPLCSGLLGSTALSLVRHVPIGAGLVGWYLSAVLGLALATPGLLVAIDFAARRRHRVVTVANLVEAGLVLGVVAGVAGYVFYWAHQSTLFVLTPVMLLATFRLRQYGAIVALGIIALIAAIATMHGHGPIAASAVSRSGHLIFLQIFLAITFMSSLPVAAALAEHDARASEAQVVADHFKAVVENVSEAIFRTDRAGCWTYLNPAWEVLSGYPVAESIGQRWDACVDTFELEEVADWARPVFSGEVLSTRRMLRFQTASGALRWMELSIQALTDKDGELVGTTGMLRDVHDRKRLEEQVMSAKRLAEERERAATLLAATDELTGLASRRSFLGQLDRRIVAAVDDAAPLAVAIFDVDHFKAVNDAHGHAIGDRVLQRVAASASGIVRIDDLVGRLGGEEFGILMPGATLADATIVAERLCDAMCRDAAAADGLPYVTVSVGVAALSAGQTAQDLLREADSALYAAKDGGRNMVRIAA